MKLKLSVLSVSAFDKFCEKTKLIGPNGEIQFIINTPSSHEAREDEVTIRSGAVANTISHCTNLSAAEASILAIRSLQENEFKVTTLQEYHA